ncbi:MULTISPECIES: hypothetical protein [Sphingobium]|uniref:Alginate export domain-containing protein n=1 Tax=Sphingobium fuliginis (strain ATCC 27551) TaxID=336203 RepID=A0ABQ1EWS0_SPHSA|nr:MULTISPECIES: hypothetical protein [Sphingobium]RYL98218.1 hypothetical protein EWH10_12445 [Sphingobium fuliginis]WDA34948.1 hypothetical protein PO876_15910 [Sphingobium sp. YC-XJ3]GFZ90953.1 hypothetical protein GCM10019071_21240 [Sphingobium fuliginis]
MGLVSLLPLFALAQPGEPVPPPPPENWQELLDADRQSIEGRRRPGYEAPLPQAVTQDNKGAVRAPPPEAFPTDQVPIPDRWRLIESLGVVKERWFDPYNQNMLKGDRPIDREKAKWLPIKGDDWFFVANAVSDTVLEPRTFPIPVGVQTTERPGSIDVFGKDASYVFSQTFIGGVALIKGATAFKPPEIEYRLTLALNVNHVNVPERRVLFVQPSRPSRRTDHFLGVQEAFVDYHLANTSDRYDFRSLRVGIQPFQSDFRGFLFNDQQLGIRLFGNRDNNRFQFNLAAFWRLEKDTNSGLNSVVQSPRNDWVFVANLYRQDFLVLGLTSQITAVYNMNREKRDVEIDDNGFPVRPALLGDLRGREYDVVYLGYNADGRIGRVNLTASLYGALGEDRNSFFTSKPARIRAFFAAAEVSVDKDWMRFRLSGLYASGDGDPYDNRENGFDAIFENPVFAGADTSYWIRQTIPFAGGGRVIGINGRNGILNSLRSSKEQGQSNFNNPGTMLLGAGADFDLMPELRVSANANHLWFQNTATLQVLRNEGSIPKAIGWDLSTAAIWRPHATQNIVFRLSGATLLPGAGFRDLFTNSERNRNYYSVLANLILSY